MSRANVEIVRKLNSLFNAGDWEAALELFHPEVEFRGANPSPSVLVMCQDIPDTCLGR
jgi:hypothetical protein